MSRIGRAPITILEGVKVTNNDSHIVVTGPKGTLSLVVDPVITVNIENGQILLTRSSEEGSVRAKHGLYRALISNMVNGVVKPFEKKLIVNGVGYKVSVSGKKIVMSLGLSHSVELEIPENLEVVCPTQTEIIVRGINKEKVGEFAAKIRAKRKVEPYHLYGIRYDDEVVIKKQGKTAGKGKK